MRYDKELLKRAFKAMIKKDAMKKQCPMCHYKHLAPGKFCSERCEDLFLDSAPIHKVYKTDHDEHCHNEKGKCLAFEKDCIEHRYGPCVDDCHIEKGDCKHCNGLQP